MSPSSFAALTDALLPAVLEAGRVEMAYYGSHVDVQNKADASPVTAADQEAEVILIRALSQAAPSVPVVAEESSAAGNTPQTGRSFFLVDPLDGTKEFIKKNGDFTINIGLIVDGKPVYGLVYAPAMDQLYVTIGEGHAVEARLAPGSAVRPLSECQTVRLKTRAPLPAGLVALESRSHRSAATETFLKRLPISEVRAAGSSIKFCLIARGEADIYPRIGPTCEWDTAAAHAVLNAAGGSVLQVDGSPFVYGKAAEKYLNPHFVAWGHNPYPLAPV
jgi:3'(2'), 5'-bisphosphate nucleotidase